jgi:hypothetical protein
MEEQQMKEIKNVKNLMNDEELMSYVTEDLEDFEEDTPVTYELWAIGYDANDKVTDAELFLGEFTDPDKAVEKAKSLTFSDVIQLAAEEDCVIPDEPVAYLSIEVETVVEDEDESTMNIGTIFKSELCVDDGENEANDCGELIQLKESDYDLDADGNLIISCDQFNRLNKNDRIKVQYIEEDNQPILTYNIISKTTTGNFVCEFMY